MPEAPRSLRIGMVCFSTPGGSGVVAAELGLELAARGHRIHFLSRERPFRMPGEAENIRFHRVEAPHHPLFPEPPYFLALANLLARVAREEGLDVIHVHYAVPHAASALLARQTLAAAGISSLPAIVTTLHGSDVTLVGSDPALADVTAFTLASSDAVTTVSHYLRAEAWRRLAPDVPIDVVPNFVSTARFRPRPDPGLRHLFAADSEMLVVHVSNFRPVKRVPEVIHIFSRIVRHVPARLLLIGDGPDAGRAREEAQILGVAHAVSFLGYQADVAPVLSVADLFLLPSLSESFGVAAAEAMACGVPVLASDVGGLGEVIRHGETGYLLPPDDTDSWAYHAVRLLRNPSCRHRIAAAAIQDVRARFAPERVVPQYEAIYARAIMRASGAAGPVRGTGDPVQSAGAAPCALEPAEEA